MDFSSKSSHFVSFMFEFSRREPKFVQFLLNRRKPLKELAGSANSQSSSYASSVRFPEHIHEAQEVMQLDAKQKIMLGHYPLPKTLSIYMYLLLEHTTNLFLEKLTWLFTNYEQQLDQIMASLH